MLSKICSATLLGVQVLKIIVETDIAERGFPQLKIVGLPGKAIEEAKERVRTALINAGHDIPARRIVVNLAPADVPKQRSSLDLPIAIGILAAQKICTPTYPATSLFIGEISLNGEIKAVDGVLPMLDFAKEKKFDQVYIPAHNADEAFFAGDGLSIFAVHSLEELIKHLQGIKKISPIDITSLQIGAHNIENKNDFAFVRGQQQAKRALEIAAAGGHNIILRGPPGTGKSMLAKAFTSILPPLTESERLDIAKIQSIMYGGKGEGLRIERAYRAPHHTISRAGMIGGGPHLVPGEVTLAHRGVLFMDEFPEFPRSIIEALRQPIEDGVVSITRVHGTVTYPCRFLLVAAANPCPCGNFGNKDKKCSCTTQLINNYARRLSGPILDRIDLHVSVPHVDESDLLNTSLATETSINIRERVVSARAIQAERHKKLSIQSPTNAGLSSHDVKRVIQLEPDAKQFLSQAFYIYKFSPRSYFKLLKVALTIADLAVKPTISQPIIAEAVQYRSFLNR